MLKLKVSGMTCGHCVASVTNAVHSVPMVKSVVVDLKTGEVLLDGDADVEAVANAIAAAGYEVDRQMAPIATGKKACCCG